jgi:hypothetical protein
MDAAKTKGEFSTLTSDGRAIVDLDRLLQSDRVKTTLAVLDSKIGNVAEAGNAILQIPQHR